MAAAIDTDRLLAWAQRIVRTPSQQTALFEAEPEVQHFQHACMAPLLQEAGLPVAFDAMGNLVCAVGPVAAPRSLLLMGYAMTHPAAAMRDPFAGEVVQTQAGQALRGRGVAEQKGALAAALAAVAAWAAAPPPAARLVFCVSTAGETGRHDAAIEILRAIGPLPPLGIVVVGTGGRVALGNKGRIDVEITVRGRAAHSSTPWAGVDAIEGVRLLLDQLRHVPLPAREHHALGRATLTPTAIETWPRATHTVQGGARITLDRRLLPGDDPDLAFEQLRAALSLPPPFGLEVTRGAFMHPCEIPPDGALMRAIAEGAARAGLPMPATYRSHGALDAGYLQRQGCEAAMWGPGAPEQWHADEEQVPLAALEEGARRYLGLLRAVLG